MKFVNLPPKKILMKNGLISLIGAVISALMFAILEALFNWVISRYIDFQVLAMVFVGSSIIAVPLALIGEFWLVSKSYEQLLKRNLAQGKIVFYGMGLGAGFGLFSSMAVLILISFRLNLLYFLFHATLVMTISTSLGVFLGLTTYRMLNKERVD